MSNNYEFEIPAAPTDKKRIVFSFGESDVEFFKCFPSDNYLGTRYDKNPVQLMILWDPLILPYNCEMQIYSPKNQLLVSVPVPKQRAVPYTILDGIINEYVTKEEYVYFQFVFTKGDEFIKSTLPIRLDLSPANKPVFDKPIKPADFDKLKAIFDTAVVNAVQRFDDVQGWVYDFLSYDGTLRFSLAWIPHSVVTCTEQHFEANEKMVARENLNIPSTFILEFSASEGTTITKKLTDYVNAVEDADFTVWKNTGDGSFEEVIPLHKSYNSTSVSFELAEACDGKVRVSCKSKRYEPNGDAVLIYSPYSGNLLIKEDDKTFMTNGRMKE